MYHVPGVIAYLEDSANVGLPLAESSMPIFDLVNSLKACLHNNFVAAFFFLSAALMCHNLFPVPILVGDINRENSTALLSAIAPLGQDNSKIFNDQRFARLAKYSSNGNIHPFGVEDLNDIKEIKEEIKQEDILPEQCPCHHLLRRQAKGLPSIGSQLGDTGFGQKGS